MLYLIPPYDRLLPQDPAQAMAYVISIMGLVVAYTALRVALAALKRKR